MPPVHIAPFLFKRIVLIEKMIFPVAAFVFTAAYAESRNAYRAAYARNIVIFFIMSFFIESVFQHLDPVASDY